MCKGKLCPATIITLEDAFGSLFNAFDTVGADQIRFFLEANNSFNAAGYENIAAQQFTKQMLTALLTYKAAIDRVTQPPNNTGSN